MAGIQSLVLPLKHEAKPTLFINPPRAPPPPTYRTGEGGAQKKTPKNERVCTPKGSNYSTGQAFCEFVFKTRWQLGPKIIDDFWLVTLSYHECISLMLIYEWINIINFTVGLGKGCS